MVRMLSKMVKKLGRKSLWTLACPNSLILHQIVPYCVKSLFQLLGKLQILVYTGWISLVFTPWAWATFPPVILCFGGYIGDESHCIKVFLVHHCRFLLLRIFYTAVSQWTILTISWIYLKLFLAVESTFTKPLWWRMDGVRRERSTANWLRQSWWKVERGGGLNLLQMDGSLNYILFMQPLCATEHQTFMSSGL